MTEEVKSMVSKGSLAPCWIADDLPKNDKRAMINIYKLCGEPL